MHGGLLKRGGQPSMGEVYGLYVSTIPIWIILSTCRIILGCDILDYLESWGIFPVAFVHLSVLAAGEESIWAIDCGT